VPDDELAAFRNEMRQAKAAWQIVELGGAVHAFTDPGAGTDPTRGGGL
jgi:dienelactone hydrolase